MIVDPLLDGTLTHVPTRGGDEALIDFCYVENAAHAHCVAVDALLQRPDDVAGSTYNVSNSEKETTDALTMWNRLLEICEPSRPPLGRLPFSVAYAVACLVEAVDWFTAGRVPCPRAAIWNLTRASLGFATTSITLSTKETEERLGYTPLFTTEGAFREGKRTWPNNCH